MLLNDESFIRWLKGESNPAEGKKWNDWVGEHSDHPALAGKAEKFLSMPFREEEQSDMDIEKERVRLMNAISELEEKLSSVDIRRSSMDEKRNSR